MLMKKLQIVTILTALLSCHAYAEDSGNADSGPKTVRGVIQVLGSVTQGACSLSMESTNQVIQLDNISTSELNKPGKRATPTSFNIELQDCGSSSRYMIIDSKTGNQVWSSSQPVVKMRFIAPTVKNNDKLALVEGVKGMGLEITNGFGSAISFGEIGQPIILNPRSNTLTYNITPVRTASYLQAGAYKATIIFELVYD